MSAHAPVSHAEAGRPVIRIAANMLAVEKLPEALEQTLPHVPLPEGVPAWALVCIGRSCLPPIADPEKLLEALEG